jgi:hypothetical protein
MQSAGAVRTEGGHSRGNMLAALVIGQACTPSQVAASAASTLVAMQHA